jgi:tetratricopeptide (TPR) repeat protein
MGGGLPDTGGPAAAHNAPQEMNFDGFDSAELRRRVRETETLVGGLASTRDDASVRKRGRLLWRLSGDLTKLGRTAERERRLGEAARLYREAEQRLREATEILWRFRSERRAAIGATVEHGAMLVRLERWEEAVEVLGRVIDEVGMRGTPAGGLGPGSESTVEVMAIATEMWLVALDRLRRWDETETGAKAVVAALGIPGGSEKQREAVAQAVLLLAGVALARGDQAAALSVWEQVIDRCDGETGIGFTVMAAQAMGGRAKLLGELGRVDEALALCDEGLRRFGSVADRSVMDIVALIRKVQVDLLDHRTPAGARRRRGVPPPRK